MTWSLNRTGHQKLSDGSVLRIDAELGRYVASFYNSDITLRAYSYGTLDVVKAVVAAWVDAYDASLASPVGGVERSAPVGIPGVEQPLMGGAA